MFAIRPKADIRCTTGFVELLELVSAICPQFRGRVRKERERYEAYVGTDRILRLFQFFSLIPSFALPQLKLATARVSPWPSYLATLGYAQTGLEPLGCFFSSSQ